MVDSSSVASIFNDSFIEALKNQQKNESSSPFAIAYDDVRYSNICEFFPITKNPKERKKISY